MHDREPPSFGSITRGVAGIVRIDAGTVGRALLEGATGASDGDAENLCIVFDGQVHNRTELRTEVERCGLRVHHGSDAEIVLSAYRCWSEATPSHIDGEFAFAIWDGRSQRLFCARDRLGVKPFHYWFDGRTFAFASDIRHVAAHPGCRRRVNELVLGLYLLGSFEEIDQTLYDDIRRLPPAHQLTVSREGISKRRYWQLEPPPLLRYASGEAYAEHFLTLFREAVRSRVVGVRRPGVLLSGGLDSASIACVARALPPRQPPADAGLETFSLLFDDPACDERQYLGEVTRGNGHAAHFLFPERDGCAGLDFDADEPHPNGPLYYPNLSVRRVAVEAAGRRGVNVLLTGLGADDLFTCYHHCADLLKSGRWISLYRELSALGTIGRVDAVGGAIAFALRPLIPAAVRRVRAPRLPLWIQPDFVRRVGLLDRLRQPRRRRVFPESSRQVLYEMLFESGAYPFAFEEENRFEPSRCVEFRAPFLDIRLIEFALALPAAQRTWRGTTKVVLRNALKGILPEAIRLRTDKADFSQFMDRELRIRQRTRIADMFATSRLASEGIVDGSAVGALWQKYCEEGGADRWTVLTLLNLERSFRALHS